MNINLEKDEWNKGEEWMSDFKKHDCKIIWTQKYWNYLLQMYKEVVYWPCEVMGKKV